MLDRRIANLVEAIACGRSSPAIMAKLPELEAQRAWLGDLVPTENLIRAGTGAAMR